MVAFASGLCDAYPKESRVDELKTISIVTMVLATLFLFLRLYSRWLKTRRLWKDDAYAVIAAVSTTCMHVNMILTEIDTPDYRFDYYTADVAQRLRPPLLERTD